MSCLLSCAGGQVLIHQRVDQAFVVRMVFMAEHGIAVQDAVLERIEADDFIRLMAWVSHFFRFCCNGRVHSRFLVVLMGGGP